MSELSIVIPTYNERERLEDVVAAVAGAFSAHRIDGEVVVVDDNSPDGTGSLADALASRYPVRAVHRPAKLGLGSAVIDGFAAAGGRALGVMDADMSHPPSIVPALLAVLQALDVDLVVGSRYVSGGAWRNWPFPRVIMSRVACALARPLTPVRDAMSGLFIARREAVEGVRIEAAGFKIGLELLLRSRISSVAEIPYEFADRVGGQSKMSTREAVAFLFQLRTTYSW
ncbi:MAG: polyprenol monophosphomannose synthase, partial [Acidobacteria bacterium]